MCLKVALNYYLSASISQTPRLQGWGAVPGCRPCSFAVLLFKTLSGSWGVVHSVGSLPIMLRALEPKGYVDLGWGVVGGTLSQRWRRQEYQNSRASTLWLHRKLEASLEHIPCLPPLHKPKTAMSCFLIAGSTGNCCWWVDAKMNPTWKYLIVTSRCVADVFTERIPSDLGIFFMSSVGM